MNQPLCQQLKVAVIGDVQVDWKFVSNEPSRPRAPSFQTWAYQPATHHFAFPGGAWFSGHMIQGAFAPAVFSHDIIARTRPHETLDHTMLQLTGTLNCYASAPNSLVVIEADFVKYEGGPSILPHIILNNDEQIPTASAKRFVIELHSEAVRSARLTIGLLYARISFETYTSRPPGTIEADTIGRRFHLTNAMLQGDLVRNIIECNLLTISAPKMKLRVIGDDDAVAYEGWPTSISLVGDSARRGESLGPAIAAIRLPESHGTAVFLKEATIEVSYGHFKIRHSIKDHGKLNALRNGTASTGILAVKTLRDDRRLPMVRAPKQSASLSDYSFR